MKEKIYKKLGRIILADNIATTWKIKCYKFAAEIELLINQEVEKRIAEVLPTKNEIGNACQLFDKQKRPLWKEAIWRAGANWAVDLIRSRLTCSEKPNNSQKTEGGAK